MRSNPEPDTDFPDDDSVVKNFPDETFPLVDTVTVAFPSGLPPDLHRPVNVPQTYAGNGLTQMSISNAVAFLPAVLTRISALLGVTAPVRELTFDAAVGTPEIE